MPDFASLTAEARLRLAALVVAVLGLGSAAAVWLTTSETVATTVDRSRSAAMQNQLERFGGKFAVLSADVSNWFDSLWAGRQLATTLLVVTALVVALLLWIAHLASEGTPRGR